MEDAVVSAGSERRNKFYKKDFWREENLKFDRPHYRLVKCAKLVDKIAQGRPCDLLDVGCGPAFLRQALAKNIRYHGIDIAIQEPADDLIESDTLEAPIRFKDKTFDIIVAQGFFEYMGNFQEQKFAEIASLLNDGGTFIATYVNFGHRDREIYKPYSNVQPLDEFRASLSRTFTIQRQFPTSHNWGHSEPNRPLIKAVNMRLSANIPLISPKLAVEYFFICSRRR
jgi:cyclopropane fatty-acyl-phospholipid synthase-like methyltransferase